MNIYDAAKVLDLTGDITPEDVKAAYKKAAMKFHPDINPAGGEMMKLVNAAYDVLKDHTGNFRKAEATEDGTDPQDYLSMPE